MSSTNGEDKWTQTEPTSEAQSEAEGAAKSKHKEQTDAQAKALHQVKMNIQAEAEMEAEVRMFMNMRLSIINDAITESYERQMQQIAKILIQEKMRLNKLIESLLQPEHVPFDTVNLPD